MEWSDEITECNERLRPGRWPQHSRSAPPRSGFVQPSDEPNSGERVRLDSEGRRYCRAPRCRLS